MINADTIVAPATVLQSSALAIVRLSGPDALAIAYSITKRDTLIHKHATHVTVYGNQGPIDDAVVTSFHAPRSFTGEDIIEFSLHGSIAIVQTVIDQCLSLGARMARPGEFTERAFLNGKMDLAQAEAVADLIASESTQAANAAVQTLKGEFSKKINHLSQEITKVRVHVEAQIDFSTEDIAPESMSVINERVHSIYKSLCGVLEVSRQGLILSQGVTVTLMGPPNAGKSSLLNWMANDDVAIVSEVAGTTRDVVKHSININGVVIRFCDTAGLRETTDQIEKMGIQRSHLAAESSQLILFCIDVNKQSPEDINLYKQWLQASGSDKKVLFVLNKCDLLSKDAKKMWADSLENDPHQFLSVKEKLYLDDLYQSLLNSVGYASGCDAQYSARQRHIVLIEEAIKWLEPIEEKSLPWDIYAEHCRLAHDALGKITGAVSVDDLLGDIFSTFCVGK